MCINFLILVKINVNTTDLYRTVTMVTAYKDQPKLGSDNRCCLGNSLTLQNRAPLEEFLEVEVSLLAVVDYIWTSYFVIFVKLPGYLDMLEDCEFPIL